MKITIDTKHDSHEDIQKVLTILTNILNKNESVSNVSQNSTKNISVDTTPMMGMFGDNSSKEVPDMPPDFPQFMKLTREASRKSSTEQPKVEFF